MLVTTVVATFVVLTAAAMPIVFALGIAGFIGLLVGNFSLQKLPSSLVAGSQSWVLLAIPTFVFAGNLMERCGMSYALVSLTRASTRRRSSPRRPPWAFSSRPPSS